MITLNEKEQIEYIGGAKITLGLAALLTAIGSFVFGVIDGIANPQKCNSTR